MRITNVGQTPQTKQSYQTAEASGNDDANQNSRISYVHRRAGMSHPLAAGAKRRRKLSGSPFYIGHHLNFFLTLGPQKLIACLVLTARKHYTMIN
jgi:hypothetical protein